MLPVEVAQAVADWEIVLPGEGLTVRPEFELQCDGSSQVPFGIRLRSGEYGDEPDCVELGYLACTILPPTSSEQIGGSYSYSDNSLTQHNQARIWIDNTAADPTGLYLRSLIAHELGHVYGLDENYVHDAQGRFTGCNNADVPTVMDGFDENFQACDTFVPTSRDIALVFQLYGLYSPQQGALTLAGPDTEITFEDSNTGEYYYRVTPCWIHEFPQCTVMSPAWDYLSNHAIYGPNGAGIGHTFWFRKPASWPEGFYRLCIVPRSARWVSPPVVCANTFLSNDANYDGDNDGFANRTEEGIPACLDSANQDSAEPSDDVVNDGCPTWGGKRELASSECTDTIGTDSGGDAGETSEIVNDGCPKVGTFSEAEIRTGTNAGRKCAATTTANDEPVDSHPADFNDDQRTTNADIIIMGPSMNRLAGDPDYKPRFDLNTNGSVTVADLILLGPYFNQPACTP